MVGNQLGAELASEGGVGADQATYGDHREDLFVIKYCVVKFLCYNLVDSSSLAHEREIIQ